MMVVRPLLLAMSFALSLFLACSSLSLYSTNDFQWFFYFGQSLKFGVRPFLIKFLWRPFLKFWNWVAIFERVQSFTRFSSTSSGNVKCFFISVHNISFCVYGSVWKHVWISCFSLPFSDADGHSVPYNSPALRHEIVSNIFWTYWLASLCHFGDMKHHITGDYLCRPSLFLLRRQFRGLKVQVSLFICT